MTQQKLAPSTVSAAAVTPVLVWVWGIWFPEVQMPPEVAAAFGGIMGGFLAYLMRLLPDTG